MTALETAVLNALAANGASVADRGMLINAAGGGSADPFMVHKAIDSLTAQQRISVTTTTVVAPNGARTTKTIISKS